MAADYRQLFGRQPPLPLSEFIAIALFATAFDARRYLLSYKERDFRPS